MISVVLLALLAAGCVRQPLDETALTGLDPELGATAVPLDPDDAERVADEATSLTRRNTRGVKHRDWMWTAPETERGGDTQRGGGLIRDDDPPAAGETDPAPSDGDRQAPTADKPRASQDGNSRPDRPQPDPDEGAVNDEPRGREPVDREPREREPVDEPPPSPRPEPPSEPAFRAIAGVADPADDFTGESPAYADIRQLLVESDGTNARVTIAVAGEVPAALKTGEVQGIGVDFFRTNDTESDYQLFVDGGDDGWRAFLQTPDGVVEYPGSFGAGGRVFVFELPWASLGGRKPADVNMFIDWSQRRQPLNAIGNDRAPQEDRVRVDPS